MLLRTRKLIFVSTVLIWIFLFLLLLPYSSRIFLSGVRAVKNKHGRVSAYSSSSLSTEIRHTSVFRAGDSGNRSMQPVDHRHPGTSGARHEHSSYGHCQSDGFHSETASRHSLKYFTSSFNVSEEPIVSWLRQNRTLCDGAVRMFSDKFGLFRNALVDPQERVDVRHLAKGGEGIIEVKSQGLNKEDYRFKEGFLKTECLGGWGSKGKPGDRILKLVQAVRNVSDNSFYRTERFTIAIARGDYANLWNHMFELYGVFIIMMALNKTPDEVSVLFLDGHPSCLLDKNWEHIFGPVQRVGRFSEPVRFDNLVIGLSETQVPLSQWQNPHCPYVEEFRTFVLDQYGLPSDGRQLDCARLVFTFVVRRNQVYHPRNLEGNVERKIFNELEVIETLMERFPGVCIQALLMESIPMRAQLEIVSETDVLIGMHGAGMMHATFLPRHAGVVELFPREWRRTRPHSVMYEVLSLRWRGLRYEHWQNPDPSRQFSERITIVDTEKIYEKVSNVVRQLCPKDDVSPGKL